MPARPIKHPPSVTEYFSGLASVYADYRPSYPIAAIKWILHDCGAHARVADVGCGTGISTRLLAACGASVIGLEPNPEMRREAERAAMPATGSVEYRAGAGERTGLEQASVDLVVCAQSFHWFDAAAALREFHRILRPGGRLALMWNVKEDADPFSAEYNRLAQRAQADAAARGLRVPDERAADPALDGFFTNIRRRVFPNPQPLTLEGVLGRARSASYFPKHGPLRDELENELRCAFNRSQSDSHVVLAHQTEVTLADRINF